VSVFPRFFTRQPFLMTLAIVALTLLFFHKLAFSGMILGRGDMYAYFYPYWTARNAALMAGRIPLWTPDIFMGVPLLANSQIGLFYPFNWPLTPLDAPTGITISLLVHVAWGIAGAYILARRVVGLAAIPALVAAVIFGLGGYVGAKVENINQLQALAWMPWLFLLLDRALMRRGRFIDSLPSILLLGMCLALQLLAGHPQTVFITLVGLGIYCFTAGIQGALTLRARFLALVRALLMLACAGVIALILASPQLLPMMELSSMSNRSGGLNPQQAMAFSLNPFVIGRGMLPSYDGLLFGEYIGYIGVVGLGLAVIGLFNRPRRVIPTAEGAENPLPYRLPWIVLAVLGFGLALGLYNPLYWTLAGLPGFSFFRVPARWLALFALGAAMLAGIGLQSLTVKRPAWWVLLIIVGLVGGLAAATTVTGQMAMDVIGPAEPTAITWIGWAVALAVLMLVLLIPRTRYIVSLPATAIMMVLAALVVVELFAASRVLAYNALVPPDTYTARRFTASQLEAFHQEQTPPGRVLGISEMQFDPGDMDALTARYRSLGMSDLAIRIALVDTKMRELMAPNLSLQWGIPSIDGFDGGLLPTGYYTAFTSLMIPPGELRTTDGRLREILAQSACRGACIPDQRWLNLTNTRYLITDKVFDVWHEGVAYDTQLSTTNATYANPTAFEATTVDLLFTGENVPTINLVEGEPTIIELQDFRRARYELDEPIAPDTLSVEAPDGVTVYAVTLVDSRTGDFAQLTPYPWARVLSSDIKLYENSEVMSRAFLVANIQTVPDTYEGTEMALTQMRDSGFDPAQTAVLHGDVEPLSIDGHPGEAAITDYQPERVAIQVNAHTDSYLVLTDAYYPGWGATVNGEPAPVYRADTMFRVVRVPVGESSVVFEFQPSWWPGILAAGAAAWAVAVVVLGGLLLRRARNRQ
jgi:hypothetical protein